MSLDWFLAWRYLTATARKGGAFLSFITAISLGGVTLGVMALIVVIAVMSGAQKDFRAAIRTASWSGLPAASPFIFSQVGLLRSGEEYANTAQLVGVSTDTTVAAATVLEEQIRQGVYDLERPASGLPPVLLGSGLADRLLVFPGDTLVVVALENLQRDRHGDALHHAGGRPGPPEPPGGGRRLGDRGPDTPAR